MSAQTLSTSAGGSPFARIALTLTATAALVLGMLAVVLAGTMDRGAAAGFGNGIDLAWSTNETLASTNVDSARLEPLPDGKVAAIMGANGADTVVPIGDVIVTRVRDTTGTWSAPQPLSLGSPNAALGTIDTYADAAGRILAVWADDGGTDDGVWSVQWAARSAEGAWSVPAELYQTRTDGGYGNLLELGFVKPRLVPAAGVVTIAWTDIVGTRNGRVDVDTEPFHARRWVNGAWGSVMSTDGYGNDGVGVAPGNPTYTQIWADPVTTSRASDGRISVAYTLYKWRPLHSTGWSPSTGNLGINEPNVWDGVAEPSWFATSNTTWVMHLDPADSSWGAPQQLVKTDNSGVICNAPDLPVNPPLVEHWTEWKNFSENPGISFTCPAHDSKVTGAAYVSDGTLRISLDYRSGPTASVTIQQYLDFGCDGAGSNTYRFCFDKWDSTDWAIDWNKARVAIQPGNGGVGFDAVQEGAWGDSPRSFTVATASGPVTVTDQPGTGNILSIKRGADAPIEWIPDAAEPQINVTHAFAHGDDVAIFYRTPTSNGPPGCSAGVLRAGEDAVTPLATGCASGTSSTERDVVQLTTGALALIDSTGTGARVRLLGTAGVDSTTEPTTEPTSEPTTEPTTEPTSSETATEVTSSPTVSVTPSAHPLPPSVFTNSVAAAVQGKARVGKKLRVQPGSWLPAPASISYQWLANGKVIKKATKSKLKLKAALRKKRISVQITLTGPGVATQVVIVKVKGKVK